MIAVKGVFFIFGYFYLSKFFVNWILDNYFEEVDMEATFIISEMGQRAPEL